jgi:hypothetical protein
MSNNPFQLQFTLWQHTPLIHFQHHQDGATLRATEVKPKLDRFIFEFYQKLFPNADDIALVAGLFNPADKKPSLYKVFISQKRQAEEYLLTSYLSDKQKDLLEDSGISYLVGVPYFAQEKEIGALFKKSETEQDRRGRPMLEFLPEKLADISKKGLIANSEIEVFIQSTNSVVRKVLSAMIPFFFVYENFGTRQSKAFGCFSVVKVNNKPFKFDKSIGEILSILFVSAYQGRKITGLQNQFESIQQDYKLLKSGRGSSERGGYAKSLLFSYGVSQNNPVRWEKRFIKQEIHSKPFSDVARRNIQLKVNHGNSAIYDLPNQQAWNDPTSFNYEYLRAMLGLAEQFEFLVEDNTFNDYKRFKYVVEVKSKNGIDRFQSPLMFKVFEDTIYLVAKPIPQEMLSSDFSFSLRMKENNRLSEKAFFNRKAFGTLKTPTQFDLADFLNFALTTSPNKIQGYSKL